MILQIASCRAGPYTKKREVALSGSISPVARQCEKGAVYQGHILIVIMPVLSSEECFLHTLSLEDGKQMEGWGRRCK